MAEELKKCKAETHLEVWCDCPNCGASVEIFDIVGTELLPYLSNDNLSEEVTCEYCKERFIVEEVKY